MVNNKYFAWYKKIVLSAQSRGTGVESHHIIPRSLGGSNEKSNRVLLTGREHLICHNLLFRCTENDDRRKMATALVLMGGRKMPSRKYEEAKAIHRSYMSQLKTGSKHTLEAREKMSIDRRGKPNLLNRGRVKSHEEILKLKTMDRSYTGKPEFRAKISAANKGMKHWHNGSISIRAKECPGQEWTNGRIKK